MRFLVKNYVLLHVRNIVQIFGSSKMSLHKKFCMALDEPRQEFVLPLHNTMIIRSRQNINLTCP